MTDTVYISLQQAIIRAVENRQPKKLSRLLKENTRVYTGMSAAETIRTRGFILASFEKAGCPSTALPFMLEELQNSKHPYLIAGAARGLRGSVRPHGGTVPYLLKAMENLSHGDDLVSFDSLDGNRTTSEFTTAMQEILATLQWSGVYAKPWLSELKELSASVRVNMNADDKNKLAAATTAIEQDTRSAGTECCSIDSFESSPAIVRRIFRDQLQPIGQVLMEDHEAGKITYENYFDGYTGLVVFFYTRCDNPNKCSLTVARLAQLQKMLQEKGWAHKIRIAAFTYDAGFDHPSRLKHYCESRGLDLNENCRSFRVPLGFDALRKHFDLGVNYTGGVVNKHTIELYIIARDGKIRAASTRLQWNNDRVMEKLSQSIAGKRTVWDLLKNFFRHVLSIIILIGFVFFPKCPLCWAAYLSVLGISSLKIIIITPWLIPLFITLFGVNLFIIWRVCVKRASFLPFYSSLLGAVFVSSSSYLLHWKAGGFIGLVLLLFSSMLISLPLSLYNRLRLSITII